MVHELKRPGRRLLALDCPFPEARAVIEGNNPGWVFVDDLNTPRAALVWAQGIQGFYLIGEAKRAGFSEELDDYIDQVLGPRLHQLGVDWFEVSGDKKWDAVIESIFGERNLESSQQWVYALMPRARKPVTQPAVESDCQLHTVEPCLFVDLPPDSKEFLFSKLVRFWGSVDAFLNEGLGYVLVDGSEIASLCFSSFVAGDIHAVDIETGIPHRRKGYAEKVARAFVAGCAEKDLRLHWDCMAENTASENFEKAPFTAENAKNAEYIFSKTLPHRILSGGFSARSSARLAEKLGFTRSHAYTLYSFPLQL